MVVILDSIREWKVLKRYATAPGGSAIYSSRGNIVAILGSLRASLAASRSWVVQSWLPARFALALRMRNERRSVGGSKLDLGPVTHRADRSNPCAGGGDDGPRDGENPGPVGYGSLGLRYVTPIVIGLVEAVGLLLAVLHGIEATIWAAAYLWLGALGSPIYMRCSIPSTR